MNEERDVIIQRTVGDQRLRADCAPAQAPRARAVLDVFADAREAGTTLRPGTSVRFGWAFFRLTLDGDSLLVEEPRFDTWPSESWNPRIDTSLTVVAAQASLLRHLDVDGQDAFFDQYLTVAAGALSRPGIFLRRGDSLSEEDSGWLVGDLDDPEALTRGGELEVVPSAHLVGRRPSLLPTLALPTGFAAILSGDTLEQVLDAAGRERMPAGDEGRAWR